MWLLNNHSPSEKRIQATNSVHIQGCGSRVTALFLQYSPQTAENTKWSHIFMTENLGITDWLLLQQQEARMMVRNIPCMPIVVLHGLKSAGILDDFFDPLQ